MQAAEVKSPDQLKEEIIRLGPWHLDVEVANGLSTAIARGVKYPLEFGPVSFPRHARDLWREQMERVYPGGLGGRSVLDCACNCGGYSFWAKELGASRCFGFDVREHWINQARWLAENRERPSDGISFERMGVHDLPSAGLSPFDIVMFKGIFYHLPDPITGLKAAADLCRELLYLDTSVRSDQPDGMLALAEESTTRVMSGVHGLRWHPTGPRVLRQILSWLGFEETRVVEWFHVQNDRTRITILASRQKGLLEGAEQVTEPREIDLGCL